MVEGGVDCHAAVDPSQVLDRGGVGCFDEGFVINLKRNIFFFQTDEEESGTQNKRQGVGQT